MNIIEAIKSGKRFRRPNQDWHYQPGTLVPVAGVDDTSMWNFCIADILADDWEIEEETVTITRSQLEKAFSNFGAPVNPKFRNFVAKELGFYDEGGLK